MCTRKPWSALALGTSLIMLLSLCGCPPEPPPPPNQSPVANAGADQTVSAGSTVTLNGTGSSDADGDPLTFQWTQTAGTSVTLNNANTATASFTAPNISELLTFQLTVDDGNGGTASDSTSVTVTTTPPPKPTLFIANNAGNVTAYDLTSPATINGNIPPNANLAGAQTLLLGPTDLVIDSGGNLLVSNAGTASITGYANAVNLGSINGNVAPNRNVQGAATQLLVPVSLAINTANDLLFAAEANVGIVHVFANASTNAFNGNLAPTRQIISADMVSPRGINFGANDELYVANTGNNTVAVFANASNLNGVVAATRVIRSAAFFNLFDVYVDQNDTMYVVNSGGAIPNQINIFANASTLNGVVTPDVTLAVVGATSLTAIAVDSANNGYIVDFAANAVYGYDNIATRNGAIPPDRTLFGANTLLSGPLRVFLQE
ncbi:MAG: hypothetical protein GX547_01365 [Phycisphaerae bacterium]|nr:hypothetical protein [Phycisphaerae bacterium]